jgi:hypothetical protein
VRKSETSSISTPIAYVFALGGDGSLLALLLVLVLVVARITPIVTVMMENYPWVWGFSLR